jgi:hypothetical protein
LKLLGGELLFFRLFLIRFIQLPQVALNVFVELLDGALELLLCDISLSSIDSFEFRAIDGHQVAAEEVELMAEEGEFPAHLANGLAVISAKVGDGLKVGCEAFDEPRDLQVAMRFSFQHTAQADPIEVAIKVELQEVGGMVWGTSSFLEDGVPETEVLEIKRIDIGVDEAHWVLLGDEIIECFGEERQLVSGCALNVVHGHSV